MLPEDIQEGQREGSFTYVPGMRLYSQAYIKSKATPERAAPKQNPVSFTPLAACLHEETVAQLDRITDLMSQVTLLK